MTDLIGKSLGRYHILEQLGEGGMATVYKAYDTRLERDVAVKVIRVDQFTPASLQRVLARFEREAKALGRLNHPNIVSVIDYGEFEDVPYLVMVYVPGGTLKQKLGKPMPWQEAVKLLLPVARALEYAHSEGLIHRDVKPSNILITRSGEPMLTDFGIAKLLDAGEAQTLTGTGMGIGTPEYMAPEQGMGREVDGRADIYSLGIVFYELVTGRKPYTADTPMAVVFKHMTDPLPRPRQYAPDLPDRTEKALLKALAKNPEDRYSDMAAFADALEGLLAGTSPPAPPPVRRTPAGSPRGHGPDRVEKTAAPGTASILHGEESKTTIEQAATRNAFLAKPPAEMRRGWLPWVIGGGVLILTALAIYGLTNLRPGVPVPPTNAMPAVTHTNAPADTPTAIFIKAPPSATTPTEIIPTTTPQFDVILEDVRVRRAIAYCTDRQALAQSVYPTFNSSQIDSLIMDSFLPKTHWAYSSPRTQYPFNPTQGQALLEQAGWILPDGATYRKNVQGEELSLKFTTTTAVFRQTWGDVWEKQMEDCGIRIMRFNVPATWWFGDTTGLIRRDFELGAFAWVSEDNLSVVTLYACASIPSDQNGWQGQNYMGWCNETASQAAEQASNTQLSQNERRPFVATLQEEFAKDVPSLPLFLREDGNTWEHIDFNLSP
jgi:serine/threonine protein kinase